jgi:hypothetical protein
MQAASQRTQTTEPSQHLVQFYDADPAAWAKSVGRYLSDGWLQGESLLVIATPEHRKVIARKLDAQGCDPESAERDGQLAFMDASATLARFKEVLPL